MQQEFCEVENTDPAQHQKWLDKHGFKEDENGAFRVDSFEGKDPVTVEKLFENIRANVSAGEYEPLFSLPYDERVFVMVCGGPSLARHLGEIRQKSLDRDRYLVVCSNMTAGYLLENGITPHVHFILDPQEKKRLDVAPGKTSSETDYWLNVACDPQVFSAIKGQGIKPFAFLADFEAEGRAIKAVQESMQAGQPGMMAIQGGTMAGLRAINLAEARGFRRMEFYGFDGAVEVADGRARPYAYEKKRGEAIIEVSCDLCPATFDTTLIFQKQVNEFLAWHSMMPWVEKTIIGGGLISHAFEHLKERERAVVPSQNRFTQEYAELQRMLHAKGDYGFSGQLYIPTIFHAISQLAKRHGAVSVLDYGSAGGHTMEAVRKHLWLPPVVSDRCYDPFVQEFSEEPELADFVICTDVLEHVEPECTNAVLDHLQSLTRRILFCAISLRKANKELADGRNAHINLRSPESWLKELKKRFIVSEAKMPSADVLLVVAQAIDDVRQIVREQLERRAA